MRPYDNMTEQKARQILMNAYQWIKYNDPSSLWRLSVPDALTILLKAENIVGDDSRILIATGNVVQYAIVIRDASHLREVLETSIKPQALRPRKTWSEIFEEKQKAITFEIQKRNRGAND